MYQVSKLMRIAYTTIRKLLMHWKATGELEKKKMKKGLKPLKLEPIKEILLK